MNRIMLLCLPLLAGHASAQPTIAWLPEGFAGTDISADGSVVVGNVVGDFSYETFRWTAQTGAVRLGRATVPVLGTGAGSPDVSYDGASVSATILSSDTMATQGIWSGGSWIETMPPLPANGVILDQSYGSAWGLSGDGLAVTGFHWISPGKAQASRWSSATGMIALPQPAGRSARVNAAGYDGSVVAGWAERFDGTWQPTAWRGTTRILLDDTEVSGEARGMAGSGDILVGDTGDPLLLTRVATIWRWDGAQYVTQRYSYLPGTVLHSGGSQFNGVSDDGALAVGDNMYTFNPGGARDGIVWTAAGGLVSDTAYLASLGLSVPVNIDIRGFEAVSADGRTIIGTGVRTDTFAVQSFLIRLGVCYPDCNADRDLTVADFGCFQTKFVAGDPYADCNADGAMTVADFGCFQTKFVAGCP